MTKETFTLAVKYFSLSEAVITAGGWVSEGKGGRGGLEKDLEGGSAK